MMREYIELFPELTLAEVFEVAAEDLFRAPYTNEEFSVKFNELSDEYDEMKEANE